MTDEVIATWLYTEAEGENGFYPQVGGNSSSQSFLDVYRRCLAIFFFCARRANPNARLILFVNIPLGNSSKVEARLVNLLNSFRVEVIQINYASQPPKSFAKSWRNQFYVLDILEYLSKNLNDSAELVILDSDVIWSGEEGAKRFWGDLKQNGILAYDLGLNPEETQNGLTELEMSNILANSFGLTRNFRATYFGGEFVAIRGALLKSLARQAKYVYAIMMQRHESDVNLSFEEAHVLSMSYHSLGFSPMQGDRIIKRIWTQPLKFKNQACQDLELALLHIPAEKKYGFRRFYNDYLANSRYTELHASSQKVFLKEISSYFGIPKNSSNKWVQDVTYALYGKVRKLIKPVSR